MALNIVLVEPEIPQNTGNIARTCLATGARLHLVRPLGFAVTDRNLKRAGMDYWNEVSVTYWDDFETFRKENPPELCPWALASTKAPRTHDGFPFEDEMFLIFGRESAGLPEPLLEELLPRTLRIPMVPSARSLNLSNAVSIVVYEALRQLEWPGLLVRGGLGS